jgi:lysozyme
MGVFCWMFVAILIFTTPAIGGQLQDEFKGPWKDPAKAIVLDPFRKNRLDFDVLETERRVAGIIHKASERFTPDSKYAERKAEAKRRG